MTVEVAAGGPGEPLASPAHAASERHYVGLATRVIAFAVDAALINLIAIIVEVGAALIVSLFHLPSGLHTVIVAIGGAAYVLWTAGYFVVFWTATGQTPGSRLMQIRVADTRGQTIRPRTAIVRVVGLVLAALPLFAGYLLIPFDDRCRGLHDRLARTVVIDAPELAWAAARAARQKATYEASRFGPASPHTRR